MSARPIYLWFILILLVPFSLSAQNSKKASRLTRKAETAIENREFIEAKESLRRAIDADQTYGMAYLKLAGIYLLYQQKDSALLVYNQYTSKLPEKDIPEQLWLRIAELNYQAGNYELGWSALNHVSDPPESLKASLDFSLRSIAKGITLDIDRLPQAINQFQLQYFPVLTIDENTIIYTKRNSNHPSADEDLVISTRINGEWIPAQSISSMINTPYNEGACSISADGNTLIFTACEGRDSYGSCDLYITYRQGNRWSVPDNLGASVNSRYWDSQPSLSADGRTLFFASNRPGGQGNRDLWMTSFNGTEWKSPVNLGTGINTPVDETTPFIHSNGSTLFFSSQGHPGLGGYDLFVTERKANVWAPPQNLGYPINTHHDELSLFINATGRTGYFAKEKSLAGSVTESVIVQFSIPYDTLVRAKAWYVTGKVLDADSGRPVGARFKMTDLNDSSDVYLVRSDSLTGNYFLALTEDKEYGVFISKKGYLFEDLRFRARENTILQPDTINILLRRIKPGAEIILENIYFEFDKYTLSDKSLTELEEIVQFLKETPGFTFEIQGHTDNIGDAGYNLQLSRNRARTVYEYLMKRGVSEKRMAYKGYGAAVPLVPNDTQAGRDVNRRITFVVRQHE